MRSSLVFTRAQIPLLDAPIRAVTGGEAGHVGVAFGGIVIDVTLWHGVRPQTRDDFLRRRTLVDEITVVPTSEAAEQEAQAWLWDLAHRRVRYDAWEIVGWVLMRELGDPDRPVCSGLAGQYLERATGQRIPDRRARLDPRHVRIAAGMWLAGRRHAGGSPAPLQLAASPAA